MRFVLMGPPGPGKGTQGFKISEALGVPHLAMGTMLRSRKNADSDLGRKLASKLQDGKLVSDEVVIALVKEEILSPRCREGFVLDGFPRTQAQARSLEALLNEVHCKLDCVLWIQLPDSLVEERILGHRECPSCDADFHIRWMPPRVENVCDRCGAQGLIENKDNNPEAASLRLLAFKNYTEQVLKAYARQEGLVRIVDGSESSAKVFEGIRKIIQSLTQD
jgi:adenylate kinase